MLTIQNTIAGAIALAAGAYAGLSQKETNGLSLWGTLQNPPLEHHIDRGHGKPWGNRTCHNSNPYTETPNTGATIKYDWTITREPLSPDGYKKNVLLINGQFPGPLLEANWGDTIQVTVHNHISGPEEGTAIHFHGFTQLGTPFMDGVPSVHMCPIAPGNSFTYSFTADLYGTSWYHSHYSAQYPGGLLGPVVVHGPTAQRYHVDLGPVFLTEWFHKDYLQLAEDVVGTNATLWRPFADSNMINGKMNFNCLSVPDGTPCESDAGVSKFRFTHGKTHRLRLINGGAGALQHFSIDGHNMTVIANDFVPVKPYSTNVVSLAVGQRTDILVEGTGDINRAYWMRSNVSDVCAFSYHPQALAAIYYDHTDTNAMPNSKPWPKTSKYNDCTNDPLNMTVPLYPIAADLTPSVTLELEFDRITNATGNQVWTVNGVGFHADYNHPILALANKGNVSYPYHPEWNVYNMGSNHTVRIVMHNNSTTATHPMHIHGHNMFVLADGEGYWDGVTFTNIENPQRRDVQQLRPGGHLVIQYVQDNPGVWPLHCHVAWHLSTGFYLNLVERPDDIKKMKLPDSMDKTCKNWQAYTDANIVDEIDSGV